jgi:hypothetical protein
MTDIEQLQKDLEEILVELKTLQSDKTTLLRYLALLYGRDLVQVRWFSVSSFIPCTHNMLVGNSHNKY